MTNPFILSTSSRQTNSENHNAHSDVVITSASSGLSGIKGLWDSRLRSTRGPSAERDQNTVTPNRGVTLVKATSSKGGITSSRGESVGGLTDTPALHQRSLSLRRSDSLGRDENSLRRHSTTPQVRPSSSFRRQRTGLALPAPAKRSASLSRHGDPIAKPLFQNYLLQELEPHEPQPALTVVLDLDETVVSNRRRGADAVLRPYCLHVLFALRRLKNLEIILWTASTKETAAPVVQLLHANETIFDDVIFRNRLWFTDVIHTKDLRLLGRDMDRVVIIENSAECCKFNPRNAILIEAFHGICHKDDAALVNAFYMVEFLLKRVNEGLSVSAGLQRLVESNHLCHTVHLQIPESWKRLPLSQISPLKIPVHGEFVKCNTSPPSTSIMKYWTY